MADSKSKIAELLANVKPPQAPDQLPWQGWGSEALAKQQPNWFGQNVLGAVGKVAEAMPPGSFDIAAGLLPGAKLPRVPNPIKAYHGSPHDFDKFDASHIGKGEGAQSYGHGLYFAEAEQVAKSYRDQLSAHPNANYVEWMKQNGREAELPKGHMYEVALHAEPQQFLDWDKPLSQQPPAVQEKFSELFDKNGVPQGVRAIAQNNKLGDALETLGFNRANGPDVSSALQEQGIAGIRYKDQLSRGAEGGTSNYVVFPGPDGKGTSIPIDVIRKYGIAGLLAAGAAMPDQGENH